MSLQSLLWGLCCHCVPWFQPSSCPGTGIWSRALCMLSKCSAAEPHPSPFFCLFWDRVSLCSLGLPQTHLLHHVTTGVCHCAWLAAAAFLFSFLPMPLLILLAVCHCPQLLKTSGSESRLRQVLLTINWVILNFQAARTEAGCVLCMTEILSVFRFSATSSKF